MSQTTLAASSTTDAVTHLCLALGGLSVLSLMGASTSAGVRGAGSISYTAPTSAIRLRPDFSPLDRRVLSFGEARLAALAVASLSASARITIPLGRPEARWRSFDPLRFLEPPTEP